MRRITRLAPGCAVALIVAVVAGCGGSSKTTAKTAPRPTASAPQTSTVPSSQAGSSAVTTAGLHATLSAPNHSPVVDQNWPFSVIATDASGRPVAGTVTVQFVFGGQVVGRDTPPTHRLKNGRWHELLKFPARAVGIPLSFQAVVHSSAGAATLSWPVKVKQ